MTRRKPAREVLNAAPEKREPYRAPGPRIPCAACRDEMLVSESYTMNARRYCEECVRELQGFAPIIIPDCSDHGTHNHNNLVPRQRAKKHS